MGLHKLTTTMAFYLSYLLCRQNLLYANEVQVYSICFTVAYTRLHEQTCRKLRPEFLPILRSLAMITVHAQKGSAA